MGIDAVSLGNIPYWPYLPMGVTNFGGDTQVFTIPDYASSQIGCTLNGQGLAAIQGQAPTLYNNWGVSLGNTNPFIGGMEQQIEQVTGNMGIQTINSCLATIAMTKNRLNAMLLQGNYSDKQKKQIEKLLEKLDEQEAKLNDLAAETELSGSEVYKKAAAIEKSVRAIVTEAGKIGKANGSSGSSGADGNDGVDVDDLNDEDDDVEPADDEDGDGIGDHATYSDEAFVMADRFYNATYCWGTEDEEFNAICEEINQDNVVDVMLAWKDTHGSEKGESFMTAFMWDADRDQKIKYGKQIKNALMIKARELGVLDKCRADFAEIDKEMRSWFWVDNDVAKNYDNIIKIIAEAEGQPYNTADFKY